MRKYLILTISFLILTFCSACQTKSSYQVIEASKAHEMIKNQENLVVDVRSKEEYKEGHIKNAISLPLETIEEDIQTKIPNRQTTILLYCQTGKRALTAAQTLVDMGYQNVYSFGGIEDWPYEVVK